jgi:hypothetical protein
MGHMKNYSLMGLRYRDPSNDQPFRQHLQYLGREDFLACATAARPSYQREVQDVMGGEAWSERLGPNDEDQVHVLQFK